jgi:protein tyrosine phosphatase (PTP) superfamily phosphohydrolase (DUF442 family)
MAAKNWRMKSLEEIPNYLEITPYIHTAGQPAEAQIWQLKQAGIEVVINLAPPDSRNAISDEQQRVEQSGLAYISIPVDWEQPTTLELEKFFSLMHKYQGKVKFVHCVLNMRVSAFVFLYRVNELKELKEDAWQDVLKIWQPEGIWMEFIQKHLGV